MKICFSARPVYDDVSINIYKKIIENCLEIDALFITSNEKQRKKIIQESGVTNVYATATFIEKNWEKYSIDMLEEYEKKYGCEPIWQYIYIDRFLIFRDYDYVVKMTVGLFDFFESIFEDSNINIYYDETIATLQSYVAYIVGKHYGVKYVSQMVARGLENKYHYFVADPYQRISGFDRNYMGKEYPNHIKKLAEEFLIKFESEKFAPPSMVFVKSKPTLDLRWLGISLFCFLNKTYHNKYDYINYKAYIRHFDRFKFYFRYLKSKKYYREADLSKKFVYYPLHYQPEASTIVCAQKYEKQLFFIDSWAKSLPADTLLYVKEHYALVGHRETNFYKQLRKYPNVILIDPWVSSAKLIDKAVAVTTLTGTAGWEAMLLRKPVFLGGSIFYENAPGIIKIDDIYGEYLEHLKKWEQPSRNDIILYLSEYMLNIYEGCVYFANPICLSEDNINKVVSSLVSYLEGLDNKK